MDTNACQRFLYAFFPFICRIYPCTIVTGKQRITMKQAGI